MNWIAAKYMTLYVEVTRYEFNENTYSLEICKALDVLF